MLKHQDGRPMVMSKLDNASTHQVRERLIDVLDLVPEVNIVLFALGDDASLASVACNAPQLLLPKAVYLLATPDEFGGQDRTFNSLDGADREVVVEIEIDSTNGGLSVGCDLPLDCGRASEVFLGGSMQPPLLAAPDQRGTAQRGVRGQLPTRETHLEPGPACSRPDFEQDTRWGALFPLPPIERNRLVPGARRDRRALGECLPLGHGLLFSFPPLLEVGEEGAS